MTQQADQYDHDKGPDQAASLPFGGSIELLLATLENDDGYRPGPIFGPEVSAAQISRTVDQLTGRRSPQE